MSSFRSFNFLASMWRAHLSEPSFAMRSVSFENFMMSLPNSADAHDYLIIEKSNCNKEVKASRSLCKSINFKISSIFYLVHKKKANALEKAVDWLTRKLSVT